VSSGKHKVCFRKSRRKVHHHRQIETVIIDEIEQLFDCVGENQIFNYSFL
jgi:hypothetical protein